MTLDATLRAPPNLIIRVPAHVSHLHIIPSSPPLQFLLSLPLTTPQLPAFHIDTILHQHGTLIIRHHLPAYVRGTGVTFDVQPRIPVIVAFSVRGLLSLARAADVVLRAWLLEDNKVEGSEGWDASCYDNDVHFGGAPHEELDCLPCWSVRFMLQPQ